MKTMLLSEGKGERVKGRNKMAIWIVGYNSNSASGCGKACICVEKWGCISEILEYYEQMTNEKYIGSRGYIVKKKITSTFHTEVKVIVKKPTQVRVLVPGLNCLFHTQLIETGPVEWHMVPMSTRSSPWVSIKNLALPSLAPKPKPKLNEIKSKQSILCKV